jgi:hypothetical protein
MECAICMGELAPGCEGTLLPCIHRSVFHPECLDQWLLVAPSCPLCKEIEPVAAREHARRARLRAADIKPIRRRRQRHPEDENANIALALELSMQMGGDIELMEAIQRSLTDL